MNLSRKLKGVTFLLLCYCFNACYALQISTDDSTKKINIILKTDILFPIIGLVSQPHSYSFTAEKLFCERHSVQLSFLHSQANYGPSNSLNHYAAEANGYQIISEYKFFVSKKKRYTGYYIGGFVEYSHNHFIDTWYQSLPNINKLEGIGEDLSGGFKTAINFIFLNDLH